MTSRSTSATTTTAGGDAEEPELGDDLGRDVVGVGDVVRRTRTRPVNAIRSGTQLPGPEAGQGRRLRHPRRRHEEAPPHPGAAEVGEA